ncbi:hypothetical protein FVE85_2659 [Porphyridium purpureum]|uniref:Uncharacterized protein n=1 Tax=Porphyridium purpureum TaxID=35688 RepID=A0A5J4YT69_PORPP|nr:hypothetical protein FVE85_2659 [Porphyridium purpureum]|eukprot:POR9526..scf227_4
MHPRACDVAKMPSRPATARTAPSAEVWAKQTQVSFSRLLAVLKQQKRQDRAQRSAHVLSLQSGAQQTSTQQRPHTESVSAEQVPAGQAGTVAAVAAVRETQYQQRSALGAARAGPSSLVRPASHGMLTGIFKPHKHLHARRHAQRHGALVPRKDGRWDVSDIVHESTQGIADRLNAAIQTPRFPPLPSPQQLAQASLRQPVALWGQHTPQAEQKATSLAGVHQRM